MNLEDHVRSRIWLNPTLFEHRGHVLEHTFFTVGNGLEWRDGQLVSLWDPWESGIQDRPTNEWERLAETGAAIRSEVVERAAWLGPPRNAGDHHLKPTAENKRLYPGGYSLGYIRLPGATPIERMPADVADDWALAAGQALAWRDLHLSRPVPGWGPDDPDYVHPEPTALDAEHSKVLDELAAEILADLRTEA